MNEDLQPDSRPREKPAPKGDCHPAAPTWDEIAAFEHCQRRQQQEADLSSLRSEITNALDRGDLIEVKKLWESFHKFCLEQDCFADLADTVAEAFAKAGEALLQASKYAEAQDCYQTALTICRGMVEREQSPRAAILLAQTLINSAANSRSAADALIPKENHSFWRRTLDRSRSLLKLKRPQGSMLGNVTEFSPGHKEALNYYDEVIAVCAPFLVNLAVLEDVDSDEQDRADYGVQADAVKFTTVALLSKARLLERRDLCSQAQACRDEARLLGRRLWDNGLEDVALAVCEIEKLVNGNGPESSARATEQTVEAENNETMKSRMTSELVFLSAGAADEFGCEHAKRLRLLALTDAQIRAAFESDKKALGTLAAEARKSLSRQPQTLWVTRDCGELYCQPSQLPNPEQMTLSELVLFTDHANYAFHKMHETLSADVWHSICVAASCTKDPEARYANALDKRCKKEMGWTQAQCNGYVKNECFLIERYKWKWHEKDAWIEATTDANV
jgi:tetratricopeptide (TPR) repeat protein